MDMAKWEAYEEKKAELKKSFAKKRVITWAIWLIVAAAMNTALILSEPKLGPQIMFTAMVILNAFALFIVCRKIAELNRYLKRQFDMIEQDEPFGKFRT